MSSTLVRSSRERSKTYNSSMEQRPFNPSEEDDHDPQSGRKQRRVSSFSKYLNVLRHRDDERLNKSESEDDAETEKPKRFRRLFSKLFPAVVEKPETEQPGKNQHQFDYESWFQWMPGAPEIRSVETMADEARGPEEASTSNDTHVATHQVETSTGAEPELHTASETITGPQQLIQTEPAEATVEGEAKSAASQSEVQPKTDVLECELYARQDTQVRHDSTTGSVDETPREPEREIIIERKGSNALPMVGLGLEYLGRKRADKRLEERVNKKIVSTDKEISQQAKLQQELESEVKENKEQLRVLKQLKAEQSTERRELQQKRAPIESITARQSSAKEVIAQTPQDAEKLSMPEQPATPRSEQTVEEVKPQKILEQVVDAAEHDIAVERIFERSHEVKDDQTVPGAAASVGTVIASQQTVNSSHSRGIAPIAKIDSSLPFVSDKPDAVAYRRAMKAGFWSAVMIIILGSMAYLVIK